MRIRSGRLLATFKPQWLATVLAGTLLCAAAVSAREPPRSAPPPPPPAPTRPASLEQAVKQVQHKTGGHILAADTLSRGKSNVYRIKVLTPQGQVQVVQMHSNANARPKPKPGKPDTERGGH